MLAFLLSEVAFFSTLIVAYITFLHADDSGPKPTVLSLPLVIGTTLCLIASSVTIHLGRTAAAIRFASETFLVWWLATMVLGVLFLCRHWLMNGTFDLDEGLTISRNLFGTTFYTLVGFHALHVTGGVIAMSIVLTLGLRGRIGGRILSARNGGLVLAFCRCGVDCRVHDRLFDWKIMPCRTHRQTARSPPSRDERQSVEMPTATVAPMVLALGVCLLAAGVALARDDSGRRSCAVHRIGTWIAHLLPGRGHFHEEFVEPAQRARPIASTDRRGRAIAGRNAGLSRAIAGDDASGVGGRERGHARRAVMPVPAHNLGPRQRARNLVSGKLAGRHGRAGRCANERRGTRAISYIAVHRRSVHSCGDVARRRIALWRLAADAAIHSQADGMERVVDAGAVGPVFRFSARRSSDPIMSKELDWPSFIFSQFIFGIVVAVVVMRAGRLPQLFAGACRRGRRDC